METGEGKLFCFDQKWTKLTGAIKGCDASELPEQNGLWCSGTVIVLDKLQHFSAFHHRVLLFPTSNSV